MGVDDVPAFGLVVLLVSLAVLLALVGNRISRVIRVPAPALFLVAAAVASDVWPALGRLSHRMDERVVTVALVVILFDGGMGIGWRRLRSTAGAVLWIGVAGTVVTAAGLAVAAHLLFGFAWRSALLLGTALAPTDPAVVFSVLGGREISGRSGTLLEGESGANDPVGIALLVAVLGATGGGVPAVLGGVGEFTLQMAVGLAVGVGGGLALAALLVLVARPVLVGVLLLPLRLTGRERLFVVWAGLKGAVPVLLGLLVVSSDLPDGERLYGIVFVVVLVSVVVQGGSVPLAIRVLDIPVSERPPQPYATGLRLRRAPDGLQRFTIAPGAAADGARVRELGLGEDAWLSLASRGGELLALRRDRQLRAGDVVLVHGDPATDLGALFTRGRSD